MMLQRLKEYAERINAVQPPGYSKRRVKWELALDSHGKLLQPICLADGDRGPEARGRELSVPSDRYGRDPSGRMIQRTSGDAAPLLAGTAEYVLGRPTADESGPPPLEAIERAARRHDLFRTFVEECVSSTSESAASAVLTFLSTLRPAAVGTDWHELGPGIPTLPNSLNAQDQVMFSVHSVRPTDLPSVQRFWAGLLPEEEIGGCLVCGQPRPLLRLMPNLIKGIPGSKSGYSFISANSDAFESYGLKNSLIAGCCRACAEAFHAGLQALIDDPTTSLRDSEQVTVFWSRSEAQLDLRIIEKPTVQSVEDLIQAAVSNDNPSLGAAVPQSISELLRSPRSGSKAAVELLKSPRDFFCLILASSGSRIAIEAWIETSVEDAKRNLARYFALQRLIKIPRNELDRGQLGPPLGLWALQRTLLRSSANARDLPPKTVRVALNRTALTGGKLPLSLLAQAVRRCQLEQAVSYERAVLVKMILLQQKGPIMDEDPESTGNATPLSAEHLETLDINQQNPAYLCGRALAVLDEIQHEALRNIRARMTDRFFAGALQSPALVFPSLLKNAQNHLAKLRGPLNNPGAAIALEARLSGTLHRLNGWPSTLALLDQGLFCLGYYHQREEDFAAARNRKDPKARLHNGQAA